MLCFTFFLAAESATVLTIFCDGSWILINRNEFGGNDLKLSLCIHLRADAELGFLRVLDCATAWLCWFQCFYVDGCRMWIVLWLAAVNSFFTHIVDHEFLLALVVPS
jgi:hypothetical protein